MLDFDLSLRIRIGGSSVGDSKGSLFGRIKSLIVDNGERVSEFIRNLAYDGELKYRITYDEGFDAYMILYRRDLPEGMYHYAANLGERFYKQVDLSGNSIAVFSLEETSEMNSVSRMEGVTMVPTSIIQSKSIAEIFLTNCAESNYDPYIPLRTEFDGHGCGFVHYGRQSKFEVDREYVNPYADSFAMEIEGINEWLENNPDEEPDIIDLAAIQRLSEMRQSSEKENARRKRRPRTSN